jgi:hypothetical protein
LFFFLFSRHRKKNLGKFAKSMVRWSVKNASEASLNIFTFAGSQESRAEIEIISPRWTNNFNFLAHHRQGGGALVPSEQEWQRVFFFCSSAEEAATLCCFTLATIRKKKMIIVCRTGQRLSAARSWRR